jgi:O-antigen ligase
MIAWLRPAIAPAYLFLCLVIGGSAQGMWGNAFLRLAAIMIVAWALIEQREEPLRRGVRQLLTIFGLALALAIFCLIPLPFAMWTALPGREIIVGGFRLLGIKPVAMPISLAPYDSVETLLALLPPLGMFAATVSFRGHSRGWLAAALIGGTVAGVLLGIMQVSSPDPVTSPWYLYRYSSFGVATGFFANSNHMASLLLVTIPFIVAVGATAREQAKDLKLRSAAIAIAGGGLVVVILGLVLNGSLAGYGLGVPVVLASLLMLFGFRARVAAGVLAASGLASLIALAMIWNSPVGGKLGGDAETSVSSRQIIFANSVDLVREFGLTGSGLGTFEKVYPLHEDPAAVDREFVNHAHNDYLELAVETGLPGIVLMLLFLAWWMAALVKMLRSPAADQFAVAGAIGSATLLLHSAVDYPLRTAALSSAFAMCLALMLLSRQSARGEGDLRPVRHVVVG